MKMRNRVLSFLLVVCMLATLLPVSALAVGVNPGETAQVQAAQPQADAPQDNLVAESGEETLTEEQAAALEANRPLEVQPVTVTVEEIENPGVDLKQNLNRVQTMDAAAPFAEDESVRVIVVLEDKGLLEQGFTTVQISSNAANVTRQAETLAQRQDAVIQSINGVVGAPVEAKYRYTVALNGLAVEVPYGDLEQIRQLPGVKAAFVAPQYEAPEDMTDTAAEPSMFATGSTVGSTATWEELGYTGEGMRIAIVDSGLDTDHPSFAADPVLTEDSLTLDEVDGVLESLNAYGLYSANSARALTADQLYRSAKVPFGFNYVDVNLELNHDNASAGDHGTHVAGIAAANAVEGTSVVGVAPNAQILVMKVFGASGGAYFDDILAALEDCYLLNVDAVNMSLGSPAGFSSESVYIDEIYARILDSDMIASISIGNSYSAAYGNGYGTNRNLTEDPDNGVGGSPATWVGGTSVASIENTALMSNYLTVDGEDIPFTDVGAIPFTGLAGEELTYVLVPGYGAAEDYAGLDVTGKVAVVSRGSLDFVTKQTNAFAAGAVGCLVYDNVEGTLINMMDAGLLPNAFISKASGELLAAKAVDGEGKLTVHPLEDQIAIDNPQAGQMSDFSSWGVTPDLQLEPDITAPGGNIYSTLDGGTYGTMSGTSMAAPHIAGMSALVLEYLRDKYDLYDAQAHTVAEALLMSTAEPVVEDTGVLYSPRKQGAGSANVYQAVTSPAYLTVNGGTPKVSFGDDGNRTGVYQFSFEVNNLTDAAQTYVLDGSVLTDQVDLTYALYGYYFMGETSRNLDATVEFSLKNGELPLQYDYNADGETDLADVQALLDAVNGLAEIRSGYDLTADGKTDTADAQALYELISAGFTAQNVVEVPANGSVRVHVTVTLSEEDKAYMDAYYENGIYVEGFVRLYAQDGNTVDLSLPFLGFYGDWSDARVFDTGWYYEDYPEYNRYPNVLFTSFGSSYFFLGLNPYVNEDYDPAHNVLSPNGDGYQDSIIEMYLGLLRSARQMDFTWTDTRTGKTLFNTSAEYVRKSYYSAAYGLCLPMIVSGECELYDFAGLADGAQLELTVDAYLDDGDSQPDESFSLPVHIDNQAPVLYTDEIAYLYNPNTDGRRLEFYVSDNYDIAAVGVLTEAYDAFELFPVEDAAGEKTLVSIDVTKYDSSLILAVCDYGCNETFYKVTFSGEFNVDFDSFYGYRAYSSVSNSGYLFGTAAYNGWYSFDTADNMLWHTASSDTAAYAAEYIDGYILAVDAEGDIFAMKAGSWEPMELGRLTLDGVAYPALDMAFDYTTNTLYVLTDELEVGAGGHLAKLDYLTGEATDVGIVTGIDSESAQGVTLACDNEGVLYTIDYSTGALYTINKNTAAASYVGETGFRPFYQQSMTVDHETDKLYWAAYQGYNSDNNFYEVNKSTGELTFLADTQDNGEMTGLFKPYRSGKQLYPENAALTGLALSRSSLMTCVGRTETLKCQPLPYYAELGEVTWTSSDETVATVEDGVITAVAEGTATITASVGDISATCDVTVSVFSGGLKVYDTSFLSKHWLTLDAADPESAQVQEEATQSVLGFMAAAYCNGWIYASEAKGALYRLDPETLQGTQIGNSGNTLYAMTFNYADGFMYGVELVQESFWSVKYYLVRVNLANGALMRLFQLDTATFGAPYGLAVDYDGNFFMISSSGGTKLLKFRLENDAVVGMESASLAPWSAISLTSLVYSGANEGLFWLNTNGQLVWIDGSDMENLSAVELGTVGTGSMMPRGLLEIPEEEPPISYAEPTNVSLPSGYLLLEGSTVSVGLVVEPWNARADAAYSVKDPTVAAVDSNGMLTGLSVGETTLGVYVDALGVTLEAPVQVVPSTGSVYGFVTTSKVWIDIQDNDPVTGVEMVPNSETSFTISAAAYYNGMIYAFGKAGQDLNYMFYFLRIDPADHSTEVISQINYNFKDMGFDFTTGTLYAIAAGSTVTGGLVQVDIETGTVELVGDTGMPIAAMTVDGQGRVFAIAEDGYLYELDKATAEPTAIGHTGVQVGDLYQSMHYDHNTGNTYFAQISDRINQISSLRLVNLDTGATTNLGIVGGSGTQITALYTVLENQPAIPQTLEPTGVSVTERNTVAAGSTVALTAHVLPLSVAQVDQTLTWTSSDESIATVNDGVVTGVAPGTVTITATTANGFSDTCTLIVTDHERRFYAYDEDNTRWISFTAEDTTDVTVERVDAEGEAPISASAWTGEALYAYDADGRFYSIDPDTFERTLVGDALYGMTVTVESSSFWGGVEIIECPVMPVDLSYDAASGKLYLALEAYTRTEGSNYVQPRLAQIGEVDVTTGEIHVVYQGEGAVPTNLLVLNGRAFYVDGTSTGMFRYIDLYSEEQAIQSPYLVQGYWGKFYDGRGFIEDAYTGTVYAIRDVTIPAWTGGTSRLGVMTLNDAGFTELGVIGEGIVANSLFIR